MKADELVKKCKRLARIEVEHAAIREELAGSGVDIDALADTIAPTKELDATELINEAFEKYRKEHPYVPNNAPIIFPSPVTVPYDPTEWNKPYFIGTGTAVPASGVIADGPDGGIQGVFHSEGFTHYSGDIGGRVHAYDDYGNRVDRDDDHGQHAKLA